MSNIDKANKYCADKCNIRLMDNDGDLMFEHSPSETGTEFDIWTIVNPICREIVREELKIRSEFYSREWHCAYWEAENTLAYSTGEGKTEPEAFIACILSIVEQEEG